MAEENKNGFFSNFRKKFITNKIAIESILFEKDKKEEIGKKDRKYLFYFIIAFVVYAGVNFVYFFNDRIIFSYNDLKSFEYLNNYLNLSISEIFKYMDVSHLNFDMPFYYFLFYPFLKIFGIDYTYSLFIINNFLVLLISIAIYLLLIESRNRNVAITGVIIFFSMPFTFELVRKFSPILLTMVFVVWSYYFYIKTEKFERTDFIPFFIVSFSFGFLSDKFFIIYVLPVLGFVSYLWTTVYSHLLVKIFIPSIIISCVFYLRFLTLGMIKFIFTPYNANFFNFKTYINFLLDSTGIVYFVILIIFFLQTLTARYLIYQPKKVLLKWLLYPFIVFSISGFVSREVVYPAVLSLIIGSSVSIIPAIRRYFIYITIIFALLNGLLTERIVYGNYRIMGVDNPLSKYHIPTIMLSIKDDIEKNKISNNVIIDLDVSEDNFLNYYTLNSIREKYRLVNIRFTNYPYFMKDFSDYIITDLNEADRKIFNEILKISNIKILKKQSLSSQYIGDRYFIDSFKNKDIELNGVEIYLYDFNQEKKAYDYAVLNISYFNYRGIDAYGLKIKLRDVKVDRNNPIIITGFSTIEILNARISDFSLVRTFEEIFRLKNVELEFRDDVIELKFKLKDYEITLYSRLIIKGNNLTFNILNIDFGLFSTPYFMSYFLNFRYDLNKLPIPLKINDAHIHGGVISIK